MKKPIAAFIFFLMVSCGGDYIDKPKNLISRDQMAEILADLALNDQATFLYPNSNLEAGTRFVLNNRKVSATDFVASYRYYVIREKMGGIAEDAQKILLEKDPKAEKYVKDKMSPGADLQNAPGLSR